MSMTREEAIEILRKRQRYCKVIADHANETVKVDELREVDAIDMAITALRPVSREMVEKVFPGCRSCKSCRSCVFSINRLKDMPCKKCDTNAECVLTEYKPSNFCPACGRPLTDEAVEMVMERLETIR